jgi:hypothetical protein
MAVIASEGLRLLIGDGAPAEMFNPLKGAAVTRVDINQRSVAGNAIHADAWQMLVAGGERKVSLECEAYATNEAAAVRVRNLAMAGELGNIRLELEVGETLTLTVLVSRYSETIESGRIKRMQCRLESSGAASFLS